MQPGPGLDAGREDLFSAGSGRVCRVAQDIHQMIDLEANHMGADRKRVPVEDRLGQRALGAERRDRAVGLEQERGKHKADANLENVGPDWPSGPLTVA